MPKRTEGFSLIEAVVVIAIMAILAGASVPLAVKALNQQREQTTRANLQAAWQACFGSPNGQVQNMRQDFGFDPAGALTDLGKLVAIDAPGTPTPLPYGFHSPTPFYYGWNGPYWTGSTTTVNGWNVPADAWGHAIQLQYNAGVGWRMVSAGQDGVPNTPDDLTFPTAAVLLAPAYAANFIVSCQAPSRTVDSPGTVTWTNCSQGAPPSTLPSTSIMVQSGKSAQVGPTQVKPGPLNLLVHFDQVGSYPQVDYNQVVYLLPGQTQVVNLTLN